jgi:mono/diheme cytochrome c family protein
MMMRVTVVRCLFLTALAVGLALWSTPAAADAAANYKAKCAMCHGADGKGDTPAGKKMGTHDFASPEVQKASDADLIAITTKGKNKMPAYSGKLSDADIKDLIGYIRQLAKGK